jgi:hypothetical protein
MRKTIAASLAASSLLALAVPAFAAETIAYTYDARGRLVKVVHTGSVNNGVQTDYEHDRADNRKKVTTTGATS